MQWPYLSPPTTFRVIRSYTSLVREYFRSLHKAASAVAQKWLSKLLWEPQILQSVGHDTAQRRTKKSSLLHLSGTYSHLWREQRGNLAMLNTRKHGQFSGPFSKKESKQDFDTKSHNVKEKNRKQHALISQPKPIPPASNIQLCHAPSKQR